MVEKHITSIISRFVLLITCPSICDSLFLVLNNQNNRTMQAWVHFNDNDETPPQTCSMLCVSPLIRFLSSVSQALELLWQRVYNGMELWSRHVWAHPGSDPLVYYQRHTLIMQHKCADTLEHTNTKALTYTSTCTGTAVNECGRL